MDAEDVRNNDQVQEKVKEEEGLKCPRCHSSNTKFCYYNNYSLTQPRYLCKACKRYWTKGGSLRTVPVGGASRKNKRSMPPQPIIHHHFSQPYHLHLAFSRLLKLPKIENIANASFPLPTHHGLPPHQDLGFPFQEDACFGEFGWGL